ncbi:MAG: hypothetical protein KIS92_11410 [Planctomycetota bacterium]|nr:hypothetical protein [Planctomycetota bacterium]
MFARNKNIFVVAGILLGVWLAAYQFVLVQPNWDSRQQAVNEAQMDLETWLKNYKPGKDTLPLPEAVKKIAKQEEVLEKASRTLKQIEFSQDFGPYTLAGVGAGGDPKNYFDKKRADLRAEMRDKLGLKLGAGFDDLGFRGKVLEEDVQLNLMRLYVLQRFGECAKECGFTEIQAINYPKHRQVPYAGADEDVKVANLYLVPIEVRFRANERQFAQMLYELQRPSDPGHSYFALKAFTVAVKDASTGMVDCWVAAGALLSPKQAKDLKLEITEEERPSGPVRPQINPDRY